MIKYQKGDKIRLLSIEELQRAKLIISTGDGIFTYTKHKGLENIVPGMFQYLGEIVEFERYSYSNNYYYFSIEENSLGYTYYPWMIDTFYNMLKTFAI